MKVEKFVKEASDYAETHKNPNHNATNYLLARLLIELKKLNIND